MIFKLFIGIFIAACTASTHSQQPTTKQDTALQELKERAAIFFAPYPTVSIMSSAVDSLYGKDGLNVDAQLLDYIKKLYFYAQYATILEKAAILLGQARAAGVDSFSIIAEQGWPSFQNVVVKKSITAPPAWQDLAKTLQIITAKELQKTTFSIADITKTSLWKNTTVTPSEIENSLFWQEYLKLAIRTTLDVDFAMILARFESEKSIFKYLPNIEISYFHPDFTQQRITSELATTNLLINNKVRTRMIEKSNDWRGFSLSSTEILPAIKQYEHTDFFKTAQEVLSLKKFAESTIKDAPYTIFAPFVIMINTIQTLLNEKFTGPQLVSSLQIIERIKQTPTPSLIFYKAEDYPYLAVFGDLQKEMQKIFNIQKGIYADDEPVFVQGFLDWINQRSQEFWASIKSTMDSTFATAKQLGKALETETKVFYYTSGAAEIIQQVSRKDAQTLANMYKKLAVEDMAQLRKDMFAMVKNLNDLSVWPARKLTTAIAAEIGKLVKDPSLSQNLDKVWEAALDAVSQFQAFYSFQQYTFLVEGGVKLSANAIGIITHLVIDIVIGQDPRAALLEGFKDFAYDLVSSILDGVTFVIEKAQEVLMSVVKACGYLIKFLTDIIVDAAAGVWTMGNFLAKGIVGQSINFDQYYTESQRTIGQYKRTISQIVTLAATVGITLATAGIGGSGGAGASFLLGMTKLEAGMLAVGLGADFAMGGTAIFSGVQSDLEVIEEKKQQHAFVENYRVWTANKKRLAQAQQDAMVNELKIKLSSELANQERSLGFYQNYLGFIFNSSASQIKSVLGSFQAALLKPAANSGLVMADLGAVYGHTTGWYDLNPSQGFALYSPARSTYAQEIAEFPSSTKTDTGERQRFWFKQKAVRILSAEEGAQEVELRLRPLYTLNSFAFGILLGGIPLDIQKIIATQQAVLDPEHLAKMIVILKENKNSAPFLGVYEHEGAGWLARTPCDYPENGAWLRFKARLQKTTLEVKCWKEGTREPDWQRYTVAPTERATLGVIFAGASVEWQTISPADTIKALPTLYKKYTGSTEQQRECAAQEIMKITKNPTIGSIVCSAINEIELLKGNFIYQATGTTIAQLSQNKLEKDIVVLGRSDPHNEQQINDIGLNPGLAKTLPNVAISLITNNAYNSNGKVINYLQGAFAAYIKNRPSINPLLIGQIEAAQKVYAETQQGPFNFGSFILKSTGVSDIINQHYIYHTNTPAIEHDYVIMALLDDSYNIINSGMPYDENINGIVSLVTGLVYNRAQKESVNSGYARQINQYEKTYGALNSTLKKEILATEEKYQKQQQVIQSKTIPAVPALGKQGQDNVIGTKTAPAIEEQHKVVFEPAPPKIGQKSFLERQKAAESSEDQAWW